MHDKCTLLLLLLSSRRTLELFKCNVEKTIERQGGTHGLFQVHRKIIRHRLELLQFEVELK